MTLIPTIITFLPVLCLIVILLPAIAVLIGTAMADNNDRRQIYLKSIENKRKENLGFICYDSQQRLNRVVQLLFLIPREVISSIRYEGKTNKPKKIVLRRGKAIIELRRIDETYILRPRNKEGRYTQAIPLSTVDINHDSGAVTYTYTDIIDGQEKKVTYDIYNNDKNEFLSLLSMVFQASRYRK